MAGSTFGNIITMTTWGESHGEAVGVVIDGFPSGISLNESDIQVFLDRRKPGKTPFSTPRIENDQVEILSGVFQGKTTGTSISLMVRNTSMHSSDYDDLKETYRPGHADYCFDQKYGFRDYRGGGRSSGRETIARVAAGAVCMQLLKTLGIEIHAFTRSIGSVVAEDCSNLSNALLTPTAMPDLEASTRAEKLLQQCIASHDSLGGTIECICQNVPAGIGDPVFHKLDALLAQAVMSVGAVKAVEIGDGIQVSTAYGSENNDAFIYENNKIMTATNHCGGILGGMSTGDTILLRAHVKPTPSISRLQHTVMKNGTERDLSIIGRHDPVIVPRAVVVIECMAAFTLADLLLQNMTCSIEHIKKIYL